MNLITSLLAEPTVDTAPFWSACDRGEFVLPVCETCERYFHYPRLFCPHCGSDKIGWKAASGKGTVYSYTHVQFSPFGDHWASDVPYCVVQIDLAEGVRFLSRIIGDDRSETRIDDRVEVRLVPVKASDRKIPVFLRATASQNKA
jgi:uncharacterized OB-fold protein